MSKPHKRHQQVELDEEDSVEQPSMISKVFSAARAPLGMLAAHRWKALAGVAVTAVGLAIGTGLVDLSPLTTWTAQNAPDRTDATAAAEPAAATQSDTTRTAMVASKPELKACFTPAENCMDLIVAAIDAAKSEILVQAYSFQAKPLVKALGRAHTRGVKVRVILDRGDERQNDRAGSRLIAERILPQVDTGVASAHNKVMIIDGDNVITGSFNFTEAAQKKNAENVLLIKGHPDVAAAYRKNWERRLAASRPYYGTMAPVL